MLAHHFTQAGLTDSAIEWWGKAGDQALRRSAFQEAIAHLGKAIEMADKESDVAQRPAAAPSQRLKLQTTYGQALSWGKGYAAPETAAAFARARDLAAANNNPAGKVREHLWAVERRYAARTTRVGSGSLQTSCWPTRRKQ